MNCIAVYPQRTKVNKKRPGLGQNFRHLMEPLTLSQKKVPHSLQYQLRYIWQLESFLELFLLLSRACQQQFSASYDIISIQRPKWALHKLGMASSAFSQNGTTQKFTIWSKNRIVFWRSVSKCIFGGRKNIVFHLRKWSKVWRDVIWRRRRSLNSFDAQDCSVTRWQNYLFKIWPFTSMPKCMKNYKNGCTNLLDTK